MARETKEQRLARIHQEAVDEFDKIQYALRDERLQCLQDRRFYSIAGAQWEGPLGEQFENKPRFEVNKIHLAVIRIINEYRNNRITVNFTSKAGEDQEALAETCADLYRADEQDSIAEEALDNGFEEAVGGGIGAWRLRAVYEDEEDEDSDRQRIRIEPIFDADSSVFFDLNAKRHHHRIHKPRWACSYNLKSLPKKPPWQGATGDHLATDTIGKPRPHLSRKYAPVLDVPPGLDHVPLPTELHDHRTDAWDKRRLTPKPSRKPVPVRNLKGSRHRRCHKQRNPRDAQHHEERYQDNLDICERNNKRHCHRPRDPPLLHSSLLVFQ
jgi:hypothetical protein